MSFSPSIPLDTIDSNLEDEHVKLYLAKFLNTAFDIEKFKTNDEDIAKQTA